MKIVIIIGIILLIIVSVWYAKKKGVNAEYYPTQKTAIVFDTIDNPVDFGYKMIWIAIKTNQKNRLAEIINLQQIQTFSLYPLSNLSFCSKGICFFEELTILELSQNL